MAKPVIFSVKEKPTQSEAIKFVTSSIKMHDVFFLQDEKPVHLNRKALIKNGKLAEIVSSSYTLIKHEDILSQVFKAIRGRDKEIRSIGLDSDGDRMIAHIIINKTYEVAPNDFVRPELLIVNSYDHSFSAGFDLAFCRVDCESVGLTDHCARWSHFGSAPDNIDFKTIDFALEHFEEEILPKLKRMVKNISKEAAIKIVVAAENDGDIPKKTARKLCEEIDKNSPKTLWDLFNLVSSEITHTMQISPSYRRQLWRSIGHLFLYENPLDSASSVKMKDIEILIANKRGPREKEKAES